MIARHPEKAKSMQQKKPTRYSSGPLPVNPIEGLANALPMIGEVRLCPSLTLLAIGASFHSIKGAFQMI